MERIKVLVRIRPFLQNENSSGTGLNIDSDSTQKIEISKSLKKFEATFDRVLSQKSTQKDVFNFVKPCIDLIKQGINCTILAYGQTGSGKTYTMFGGEWAMNDKSIDYDQRKNFNKDKYNFILNEELMIDPFSKTNGIIPNLIMSLFQTYANDTNIIITCSYIQIYNERVYDLLVDEEETAEQKVNFDLRTGIGKSNDRPIKQKPLKIKYDKKNGVIIEGVNEIRTPNFYDIFELLRQGEINRKIRQTKRNEMSSRSHTIFIINIQNEKLNVVSKIKLCDLAGSERYDSRESYKKLHFDEMVNINKSLLILGNVIHALGANNNLEMTDNKSRRQRKIFAPYKDSKLTQILEDSLGGNSVTYLLATISPCEENFEETLSTLKFADRAHSIMTTVSMNKLNNLDEGVKSKEFSKICEELFQLKQLLNIRKKRGTLEPIQEELLKLKDENMQLRKYLGGGTNVDRIKELMDENKHLRKEIKSLNELNKNLKNEIKNKPLSHYSEDNYNDSNKKQNNYSAQKNKNMNNINKINKIGNNNTYKSDINNTYSTNKNTINKTTNNINNNDNNRYKNNANNSNDINGNGKINKINNNLSNLIVNNGKEESVKTDDLQTLNELMTGEKNGINNINNNTNNNNNLSKNLVTDYNKYDIDDMLDFEDNTNFNMNNVSNNNNNYNKNSVNKYSTKSKNSVLKDSGQNIVYGMNNNLNKNLNEDNYNLDDINYDDLDYDSNAGNNLNKKNNNNKAANPKISKLKNTTSPYERIELLNQLEMENQKETEKLLEDMAKNQNLSQNIEDI